MTHGDENELLKESGIVQGIAVFLCCVMVFKYLKHHKLYHNINIVINVNRITVVWSCLYINIWGNIVKLYLVCHFRGILDANLKQ